MCQQTSPNIKVTSYWDTINSVYPISLIIIRHSTAKYYNLLGGVQSGSRPVHHPTSSLHWPNLIEKNVLEKISSDLATLAAAHVVADAVPFATGGGIQGYSPSKQSSKPTEIEIWNTTNRWGFACYINLSHCQTHLHKHKTTM